MLCARLYGTTVEHGTEPSSELFIYLLLGMKHDLGLILRALPQLNADRRGRAGCGLSWTPGGLQSHHHDGSDCHRRAGLQDAGWPMQGNDAQ